MVKPLVRLWASKKAGETIPPGFSVVGWTASSSLVRTMPTTVSSMVGPVASSVPPASSRKPAVVSGVNVGPATRSPTPKPSWSTAVSFSAISSTAPSAGSRPARTIGRSTVRK